MKVDAIVIGGGIHGCSTALHLALKKLSAVVVEKDYVGRHASGVNAGGVRRLLRHPAEIPLSVAAMERWLRIDELVGYDCRFRGGGQVAIAETAEDMAGFEARAAEVRALGYDHEEPIDRVELRRLLPALAGHCIGGLVSRLDGHADPYRSTLAFKRRGEALGVRFFEGARVTGIEPGNGGWRVATTGDSFEAEIVVNCAGAWAHRVAKTFGEAVPESFFAPMMMVTSRMAPFLTPVAISFRRGLSIKQTPVGTVLIGGGHPGVGDLDRETAEVDFGHLSIGARAAVDLFPVIRQARVVRCWAGLEGVMPDDIPVIGPSRIAPGVWHAFGFCGHGFQLAPIVGSILAELIVDGRSDISIEAFRVDRFNVDHT